MIGVTNNSPQQINAALIAMKNEVKKEITEITNERIEQVESNIIDDSAPSLDTTYSSSKIESELSNLPKYPLGFIYMQLYNPTSASWEKSPLQLGMTPEGGCEWTEITGNFANYPYLKIGSGTIQNGHNAYHRHSINMLMYAEGSSNIGYSVGWNYRRYQQNGILTDYEGNAGEQTNEVNASGMKIWKVVADT